MKKYELTLRLSAELASKYEIEQEDDGTHRFLNVCYKKLKNFGIFPDEILMWDYVKLIVPEFFYEISNPYHFVRYLDYFEIPHWASLDLDEKGDDADATPRQQASTYDFIAACGHWDDVKLSGKYSQREQTLADLRTKPCRNCQKKAETAKAHS